MGEAEKDGGEPDFVMGLADSCHFSRTKKGRPIFRPALDVFVNFIVLLINQVDWGGLPVGQPRQRGDWHQTRPGQVW